MIEDIYYFINFNYFLHERVNEKIIKQKLFFYYLNKLNIDIIYYIL